MALLNSTILEHAWLEGSNDFQQRIPNPEIHGYSAAVDALFDIQNNDLLNAFTGLLNGIIGTYVEGKRFENPLRKAGLFKPAARFGNSERHIAIKYLQAHCNRPDDETLLKLEQPEFVEWFYSVGKPRRYEFSWARVELERAFAGDGYGFEDLLTQTINQMYSSDAYDEMNIMIQMFAEADNRLGGLYREQLSAAPTTEATARELLAAIRRIAGRMKFPTMLYNHIDVPVFESGETLVLWITPEAMANIDVYGLATVFQLDKADIRYRIVEIPEFPIPNVYAALTSEDFIYARDVNYGMEPAFYNPGTQTYKYYLHHREFIGVNPAANCVLFTTDANTQIPTITVAPTAITFTAPTNPGTVKFGDVVQTVIELTGTIDNVSTDAKGNIGVEPDAAFYTVSASRTSGGSTTSVELAKDTFMDSYGRLHVEEEGGNLQIGDVITVVAKTVYMNPSGSTPNIATKSLMFDVVAAIEGNGAKSAKDDFVSENPFITYSPIDDISIQDAGKFV